MIELYSTNESVATGSAIPLDNVSLQKGITAVSSGASSINLNTRGIYEVTFDTSVTASEVPTTGSVLLSVQLEKDNVAQPQAQSSVTPADTTTVYHLSFTTLIQVNCNNNPGVSGAPVSIALVNNGVPATFKNVNVCVTKLV